jgi:hypothetical protein
MWSENMFHMKQLKLVLIERLVVRADSDWHVFLTGAKSSRVIC